MLKTLQQISRNTTFSVNLFRLNTNNHRHVFFSSKIYFPSIPSTGIPYIGGHPKKRTGSSENDDVDALAFQHYNASEVIMNKSMSEWCRFSVCYWHTFCNEGSDPFGSGTLSANSRPWQDNVEEFANLSNLEQSKLKADAAFEFFTKLGVKYYTFHDRDIVAESHNVENSRLDLVEMTQYLATKQSETGVKLLWGTSNCFSHPRFMNGAGSNPNVLVFAHAAAQIKQAMLATHTLGGQNYVFWGGREGYMSLLNTNLKLELDHMAALFQMAVDYKAEIGATFQLLIEPKPREPTKHQYDYDAMTVIGFLHQYGLESHFKLNIEPNHTTLAGHEYEHDLAIAAQCGMLGSVDCNTGDLLLGWDTDQFNMDEKKAVLVMKIILKMNNGNGISPGGLNFDAKVRRESTNIEDLFIAHIASMDTFAKGLRLAAKMIENPDYSLLETMLADRYKSWDSEIGKSIEKGTCSFDMLEKFAMENDEPALQSGQQEKFEMVFQRLCSK